jgi:transcriptional regulator with XRE-family HTH domain
MTTNTMNTMKIMNKITGGRLTLGKAIRSIRLCEECKQGDFAKRLRVTQSYLSDMENDRKEVSPSKALEFAKRLKQSKKQFVRLALQDALHRQGIEYDIEIRDVA